MDMSRKRAGVKSSVVAGSVWESRMKSDEVKGGFKVFNGGEEDNTNNSVEEIEKSPAVDNSKKQLQPVKRGLTIGGVAVSGKRKTWKSESFDGFDKKNPIHIARGKTEQQRNCENQLKELSVSADGIKKSPIQVPKGRSELKNMDEQRRELSVSLDGIKKNPIQIKKGRSESVEGIERSPVQMKQGRFESVEGNGKSPVQIKKSRSDTSNLSNELCKEIVESGKGIDKNSVHLRKAKSEPGKVASDQSNKAVHGTERNSVPGKKAGPELVESDKISGDPREDNIDGSVEGNEKRTVEIQRTGSDENCKEFGVCQEKVISSSVSDVDNVKSTPKVLVKNEQIDDDDDDEYDDGDEEFDEEDVEGEEEEEEIDIEIEKKSIDVKEVNVTEKKPNTKIASEVKVNHFRDRATPFSSTVNKEPPPVIKRAASIYSNPAKPIPNRVHVSEEHRSFPHTQNKLQNLVDLVMWRDVSKSAFIFGIGTFIIISSSYTSDLNVSFISVISYVGLVYLAAIFLYRSIICRGLIDVGDTSYVVGEEEAVWLLKWVLPYLNEFLLKLRALFSGDPATTMKLAVLLFVLARCGSSITIWKMAKIGFFGVFTVPKVCSAYSSHLSAYGKFWIRRFRDAWESCSHKKAVAFAIFTLVWNLSSMVARIWAVFMLFVALRYYQLSMLRDEWVEEDAGAAETSTEVPNRGQRHKHVPFRIEPNKVKKGS